MNREQKRALGTGGLMVLAGVTLLSSVYTVDQTEQAVVTQFGKPVRVILNPIETEGSEERTEELRLSYEEQGIGVSEGAGLRWKIPFLQDVRTFDRRLLRWNGIPEEIPTEDKKYIWVDATARWRIEDPLQFFRSVTNENIAQSKLDNIINSATRDAITNRKLIEIVRTDNREMVVTEAELGETINVGQVSEGRPVIIDEIIETSQESCREYGIRIHDAGVLAKGLTYVESVKIAVEDRMISERKRIAAKYVSEGEGEYARVMGKKDREVRTILSGAYREARTIEGEADSTVTRWYADGLSDSELEGVLAENEGMTTAEATTLYGEGFGVDASFYQFYRTLELYGEGIAGEGTRMIFGTENPLLKYLGGIDAQDETDRGQDALASDNSPN